MQVRNLIFSAQLRRRRPGASLLWATALAVAFPAAALDNTSHLSLEGISGFGAIPHAQTLDSGMLAVGYSDLAPAPKLSGFSSYAFGLGLFERLELSGRVLQGPPVANSLERIRDLSAGLKLQLFRREGWPSLAVGAQDLQGNRLYQSQYAVTSWVLGPLHLSAGYGWDSANLAGTFGGLEWRPAPWFAASAEHAEGGDRVAVRLTTPAYKGIALSGLAARNLDDNGDTNFGVEISVPLAGARAARPAAAALAAPPPARAAFALSSYSDAEHSLTYCIDDRLGHRNPQDAFGVAARQLRGQIPADTQRLRLVLVRDGYPALAATTSAQDFTAYFERDDDTPPELSFAAPEDCTVPQTAGASFKPQRPPVELVLEPNLVSFVATEYGSLDADLSLRARLQLPLLRGLGLLVSALSPSLRTDDFDDGGQFERFRSKAGVDQALLQWFGHPSERWQALTSLGHMRLLQDDALVLLQEHALYFGQGADSLRLHLGAIHRDAGTTGIGIAELAHHFVRQDTSVALAGGRFAAGDSGGRFEITRFFGDTAVTAFVKAAGRGSESAGGLRISFPLTGRYPAGGGFVLRGAERWSHSQQSTFSGSSSGNVLRPNLLVEPQPDRNLRESYLNLYRATPAWIGAHAAELQQAYSGN